MQQLSAQFQAQWRAQQDAHRRQAILADMLFQTERRAKQLSALAQRDAIVSAMFADEWLSSVRFVGPEAFVQIEHKKVWAAATSRLQALTRPLADPIAHLAELGAMAADVVARAIARGVYEAKALPFPNALPSWRARFAPSFPQ